MREPGHTIETDMALPSNSLKPKSLITFWDPDQVTLTDTHEVYKYYMKDLTLIERLKLQKVLRQFPVPKYRSGKDSQSSARSLIIFLNEEVEDYFNEFNIIL